MFTGKAWGLSKGRMQTVDEREKEEYISRKALENAYT